MVVLEAAGLSKHFRGRRGFFGGDRGMVRAVDGISFAIEGGQTLGVVGESGLRQDHDRQAGARARGADRRQHPLRGAATSSALDAAGRRHYRKSVQAVFQDPYASLNPRMRVGAIIAEPLVTNEQLTPGEVKKRVLRAARSRRAARAARRTSSRTSSPAGSASASPLPAPWRCRPSWSCWTSRSPPSTYRSGRRS